MNKINKKDLMDVFARLPKELALKILIRLVIKYAQNKSGKSIKIKKTKSTAYKSNLGR